MAVVCGGLSQELLSGLQRALSGLSITELAEEGSLLLLLDALMLTAAHTGGDGVGGDAMVLLMLPVTVREWSLRQTKRTAACCARRRPQRERYRGVRRAACLPCSSGRSGRSRRLPGCCRPARHLR